MKEIIDDLKMVTWSEVLAAVAIVAGGFAMVWMVAVLQEVINPIY